MVSRNNFARMRRGVALVLLAACSGSGTEPGPAVVASVSVSLDEMELPPGFYANGSATMKDASGNTLADREVTWESSNVSVATVHPVLGSGVLVQAVAAGQVTISATSEGVTGSATLTVLAPVASVSVSLAMRSIGVGQSTQATAIARDATGQVLSGRVLGFVTNNIAIATVNSETGVVTAVAPGTVVIGALADQVTGNATLTVCQPGIAPPPNDGTTIHVSAALGNDATGTGTCAAPFRTITRAMTDRVPGDVVRVAPGTYNAALGEVFPIMLPAGVHLVGDEANKGQGTAATRVIGGASLTLTGQPCGTFGSTIYAGANSTIAGFELTNDLGTFAQMTLLMRTDGVTVRNNSIVNKPSGGAAVYFCNGSQNHVITGNVIRDNAAVGLGFISGGVGARVEQNLIVMNQYGVEYDAAGGDMGGGTTGSVGGNTISCNVVNDLWTNTPITINMANNLWDHVAPSGNDINNILSVATILTTGAILAVTPCP